MICSQRVLDFEVVGKRRCGQLKQHGKGEWLIRLD